MVIKFRVGLPTIFFLTQGPRPLMIMAARALGLRLRVGGRAGPGASLSLWPGTQCTRAVSYPEHFCKLDFLG